MLKVGSFLHFTSTLGDFKYDKNVNSSHKYI